MALREVAHLSGISGSLKGVSRDIKGFDGGTLRSHEHFSEVSGGSKGRSKES